jgi:hypothetical protein
MPQVHVLRRSQLRDHARQVLKVGVGITDERGGERIGLAIVNKDAGVGWTVVGSM